MTRALISIVVALLSISACRSDSRASSAPACATGGPAVRVATANSYFGGELPMDMRHYTDGNDPRHETQMFHVGDFAHPIPIEKTWGTLDALLAWVLHEKIAVVAIGERAGGMNEAEYDAFVATRLKETHHADGWMMHGGIAWDTSKVTRDAALPSYAMKENERTELLRSPNDARKYLGNAALFHDNASKLPFVFIAVGLPANYNGLGKADDAKRDELRAIEARLVRVWANELEPRDAPRFMAGDFNSIVGSKAHDVILADYDDGNPKTPAGVAPIDFILYDHDGSAVKRGCGFASEVLTGENIGSDHRPRVALMNLR